MAAPTVANARQTNGNGQQGNAQTMPPIPFTRAARRKSKQDYSDSFSLQQSAPTAGRTVEITAAGFVRYLDIEIELQVTGNTADVALPGATSGFPWNIINSIAVTNAAGDSIFVPISGYQLYLVNKYGNFREAPARSDPYRDPSFSGTTTGVGGTAGSFTFRIRVPFELDPRDGFCALPNLAANKAYQLLPQWASIDSVFAGGTPPNGSYTLNWEVINNYWSQPQAANGDGYPQETQPKGLGSVSLYRLQSQTVSPGSHVIKLYNVGNVIRWGAFILETDAGLRTDADFPDINYLRLNNDSLFYKPKAAWESEMQERYGYGGDAATAKDEAGGLDTGVYVLSDFMAQHGHVTVDGPRDQYLVTLDATLFQYEGNSFGANADRLVYIQNEIKPASAQALYSVNVV